GEGGVLECAGGRSWRIGGWGFVSPPAATCASAVAAPFAGAGASGGRNSDGENACRIATPTSSEWAVFTTYATAPAANAACTCAGSSDDANAMALSPGTRAQASRMQVTPPLAGSATRMLGRSS